MSAVCCLCKPERWHDWRWQFRHRLRTIEQLGKVIKLTPEEEAALSQPNFVVGITPYFASLMDPEDPTCPIRRQAIPLAAEGASGPGTAADPLNEEGLSPVSRIIHRYPDRVVLLGTETCHTYCRHCTRRRRVGMVEKGLTRDELEGAVEYIAGRPEIRDVLISGGDPLTLANGQLDRILAKIRAVPHVEIIRIGTRAPVTNPYRITPDLVAVLKKYHPLWINVQFNHPKEITEASARACAALVDAGIPVGNQTVLLKGINDSVDVQKRLVQELLKLRIRPYYLYQCDLAKGIDHFRTPVARGIEIIEGLRGHTSGLAVPTFVIDAPGGGGKIPVSPQYVISQSPEKVVLRTYDGKIVEYPEPQF
jgi:lysine 2,3-aminomutase